MKNQRGLWFLFAAAVCGLIAVFIARSWLHSQIPAVEVLAEVETVPVVVASIGLPAGSELASRQVDTVEWPKEHLPEGALLNVASVDTRVLRRAVTPGEPVLESALLPIGSEGGLTPLIQKNHRAMSVKVDAVVGVAGFVKPGARVDVLATVRRLDRQRQTPESRIILQDLRVLAIDQTLEEVDNGQPKVSSVVTLEVDPQEAQKLAYATANGTLQLALRNPGDSEEVATRAINVRDLVRSERSNRNSVESVRGSSRSRETL